jgi:hypothetical protein
MRTRRKLAIGLTTAAVLLGSAGAVATAHTLSGPPAQGPVLSDQPGNGPDNPDVPDIPEPGDTADAPAP